VEILADRYERESGVPKELVRLGVEVHEVHLRAGDYAIGDFALVERKTTRGLHLSIFDGRFWPQLGKMRGETERAYLLVEGGSPYDGPLSEEAIRGLILAVIDLGIAVIRSANAEDSARWIRRIMLRRATPRLVDRPPYAQRPKREPHVAPPERALAAAAGVSTTTARALLTRFGCLTDVLLATPEELMTVSGVGRKRAQSIHELATERLAIPASAGIA
jgi:DNA excision repair protein ERCC-4